MVIIKVFRNATLNFLTECPVHGRKGIPSPFSKSIKLNYSIEVAKDFDVDKRDFSKDMSKDAMDKKEKYYEEWKNKQDGSEPNPMENEVAPRLFNDRDDIKKRFANKDK